MGPSPDRSSGGVPIHRLRQSGRATTTLLRLGGAPSQEALQVRPALAPMSTRVAQEADQAFRGRNRIAGGAVTLAGRNLHAVVPSDPVQRARTQLREEATGQTHGAQPPAGELAPRG